MVRRIPILEHRVAQLDEGLRNPATGDDPVLIVQSFLLAMATISDPSAMELAHVEADPSDADEVVHRSALLTALGRHAPDLMHGPVRRDAQFWVGGERVGVLARERFVDVGAAATSPIGTKPFFVGLFTSTGLAGTHGMWRIGLDLSRSSLWPRPWRTWSIMPAATARVYEADTAAAWVRFVTSYPSVRNGLIEPDWRSAARDYDGVHVGLHTVAAVQGLYLRSGQGLLAPAYWDTECTFWLHWCFESAVLVDVTS